MTDEQKQETAVATTNKQSITMSVKGGLQLTGLNDMFRFAQYVAASGLAPKGMDKPEQILIALELGYEVGLQPMNAIQNIAVVNGRPSIWGDAMLALVRSSGLMKKIKEEEIGTPYNDDYGYRVTVWRKPDDPEDEIEPVVRTFTVAKAKKAGLWGKSGPWTQYSDRMLLLRARGFALRDGFPDVLKGMISVEEARDIPAVRDAEYEIMDAPAPATRTDALAQKLGVQASAAPAGEVATEPEPEPVAETKAVEPEPEPEKSEPVPEPESKTEKKSAAKRPCTVAYGENGNVWLTVKEFNAFAEQYGHAEVDEIIHEFSTAIKEKGLENTYPNHQRTLAASLAKKFPPNQGGLNL